MVVAEHFSGAANLNKIDKIPEYVGQFRKEWLFIRGINKECEIFVKKLDDEGKIFKSPKANRIKLLFKRFLKAQERGRLQDISEFYFKEDDVKFIESLEINLDDYMDIFHIPGSCIFDNEKYENDNTGLKEFNEIFSRFKDKIRIEEFTYKDFKNSLNYLSSDSDSDSDSDY